MLVSTSRCLELVTSPHWCPIFPAPHKELPLLTLARYRDVRMGQRLVFRVRSEAKEACGSWAGLRASQPCTVEGMVGEEAAHILLALSEADTTATCCLEAHATW